MQARRPALPAIRRRAGIALLALEHAADRLRPSCRSNDPGAIGPWRVVPHMLVVPAFQLSYPMPFIILVKTDDSFFHA